MTAYPVEEAGIYTSRIKVEMAHEFHYLCPAPLTDAQIEELNWLAAAVFRVTGCLDVARVDFRLDANDGDRPYILEVNPLPGLNPGYSDLCIEAAADGWSYNSLINKILDLATERYSLA
jgi:D-alanine-D-alanine ligase